LDLVGTAVLDGAAVLRRGPVDGPYLAAELPDLLLPFLDAAENPCVARSWDAGHGVVRPGVKTLGDRRVRMGLAAVDAEKLAGRAPRPGDVSRLRHGAPRFHGSRPAGALCAQSVPDKPDVGLSAA